MPRGMRQMRTLLLGYGSHSELFQPNGHLLFVVQVGPGAGRDEFSHLFRLVPFSWQARELLAPTGVHVYTFNKIPEIDAWPGEYRAPPAQVA